jgi:hypothetical protein
MTKEENLEHVKKGLGRRFPIGLKDEDYETIYAGLERDCLVEQVQGKLKLTEKGRRRLKMLAEKPVAANFGTQQKFLNARKIDWFAEGL